MSDIVISKNKRKEHFLHRCKIQHGDKFDYTCFDYKDAKTKGLIKCPIHGEFYQTPDKHLAPKARGCPKCWIDAKPFVRKGIKPTKSRDKIDKDEFLERCRLRYGDKYKYNLDAFDGIRAGHIIVTCPIHGDFKTTAQNHLLKLNKTGCPKCGLECKNKSKTKSYQSFIDEANAIHNNKYSYPEDNQKTFKNRKSKVNIVCKKHGQFNMAAQKHLSGQRCWLCVVDDMIRDDILIGGYSERLFEERPELKSLPAHLYYFEIDGGRLYKIGITRIKVSDRLKAVKSLAGKEIISIKVLKSWPMTLYDAFKKEQEIIDKNKANRKVQSWSTEVFDKDILDFS